MKCTNNRYLESLAKMLSHMQKLRCGQLILIQKWRQPVAKFRVHSPVFIRNLSSTATLRTVPEGTKAPELILPDDFAAQLATQAGVEPTFQSLGLAHMWPSGWLQSFMETVHLQMDLPWWATIVTSRLSLIIIKVIIEKSY